MLIHPVRPNGIQMALDLINSIHADDRAKIAPAASITNRASIVAIDDDPLTLHLLSSHLNKAGYGVQIAETGTAGLELVNRDRGRLHSLPPPTPPGIRVRTTAIRLVKLS